MICYREQRDLLERVEYCLDIELTIDASTSKIIGEDDRSELYLVGSLALRQLPSRAKRLYLYIQPSYQVQRILTRCLTKLRFLWNVISLLYLPDSLTPDTCSGIYRVLTQLLDSFDHTENKVRGFADTVECRHNAV